MQMKIPENWQTPANREQAEAALDAGRLYMPMRPGNPWQARRNGATKTWKRDPARFRIPVTVGFRTYFAITETNLASFVIKPE
jgi:hypothetical protein